jgi:hypothetical protein
MASLSEELGLSCSVLHGQYSQFHFASQSQKGRNPFGQLARWEKAKPRQRFGLFFLVALAAAKAEFHDKPCNSPGNQK